VRNCEKYEPRQSPELTPHTAVRVAGDTTSHVFVESVRDHALTVLNPFGHVISWNAGAETVTGYAAVEILGRHCSVFHPPESVERGVPMHELALAVRDGRVESEGWRLRKDGSRYWAHVVITPLRESDGRLIGHAQITRDLTERRKHEAALRESEERCKVLVESVIDYAIATLDEGGMVTSWNHGAERITGYAARDIVGRSFSLLYPPEDLRADKPGRQLLGARELGRIHEESWRIRRDGSQYWANSVIATVPELDGSRRGYYLVMQDLTSRRRAESLADTTQRMHEFIAMLAHELRNPLAPIRNAVAILSRQGTEDPLVEVMRLTIDRQSQALTRIVNELLDVNRVARGQFAIEKEVVDLRDVVARAVETTRPAIDARGHTLHVDIADHPIECSADPMRLAQVIGNILDNAAKYTTDGGTIWLSAERNANLVELRVRDSGRGIARDDLDRVFDLFTQIDPCVGSALGGLGVGLALVRRIVELHGGYVHAMSAGAGKGSEFVVRLPIGTRTRLPAPAVSIAESPGDFQPFRVLVVDDNVDFADSLCVLIKTLGHETRAVYDGPAAIAAAEEFAPDVTMLDIGMPIMNGYQVARALRHANTSRHIVAVTGWGHAAAQRQAREGGFDHHLVKPVSESKLIELLASLSAERAARLRKDR
jgi:PAS domain S-box-containing protein